MFGLSSDGGLRMYKLIICSLCLWSPASIRLSSPYFGPSRPSAWQWRESRRLGDTNLRPVLLSFLVNFAWACVSPGWVRRAHLAIFRQALGQSVARVREWCCLGWCLQDLEEWVVVRCAGSWRGGRDNGGWLIFRRGGQFWRRWQLRRGELRRSNRPRLTWFYYKTQFMIHRKLTSKRATL